MSYAIFQFVVDETLSDHHATKEVGTNEVDILIECFYKSQKVNRWSLTIVSRRKLQYITANWSISKHIGIHSHPPLPVVLGRIERQIIDQRLQST